MTERELNRIEKRAIEAQAMAPLIEALSERIGKVDALAILRKVNEQEAFSRGRRVVADEKDAIEALAKDVATWGEGGVMEIHVLEKTSTTLSFNVTRCPYQEKYRELGLEELGTAMSCCRDGPHARGLNSNLRLVRTKTIMEGADHCDFRYRLSQE